MNIQDLLSDGTYGSDEFTDGDLADSTGDAIASYVRLLQTVVPAEQRTPVGLNDIDGTALHYGHIVEYYRPTDLSDVESWPADRPRLSPTGGPGWFRELGLITRVAGHTSLADFEVANAVVLTELLGCVRVVGDVHGDTSALGALAMFAPPTDADRASPLTRIANYVAAASAAIEYRRAFADTGSDFRPHGGGAEIGSKAYEMHLITAYGSVVNALKATLVEPRKLPESAGADVTGKRFRLGDIVQFWGDGNGETHPGSGSGRTHMVDFIGMPKLGEYYAISVDLPSAGAAMHQVTRKSRIIGNLFDSTTGDVDATFAMYENSVLYSGRLPWAEVKPQLLAFVEWAKTWPTHAEWLAWSKGQ